MYQDHQGLPRRFYKEQCKGEKKGPTKEALGKQHRWMDRAEVLPRRKRSWEQNKMEGEGCNVRGAPTVIDYGIGAGEQIHNNSLARGRVPCRGWWRGRRWWWICLPVRYCKFSSQLNGWLRHAFHNLVTEFTLPFLDISWIYTLPGNRGNLWIKRKSPFIPRWTAERENLWSSSECIYVLFLVSILVT